MNALASVNGGQLAGMRNRVINGGHLVNQRQSGVLTLSSTQQYAVDRFYNAKSATTGTVTVGQSTISTNSKKSLKATATSAVTDLTGTNYVMPFGYVFEAQDVFDLNGKSVTLSFEVETNWTGNLAVSLRNSGATRSYTTYVPVTAGVNNVSVTIPLEASTVAANDSNTGINLNIGFCNQGSYVSPADNQWSAGNFLVGPGQTPWANTTGNFVNITEVQFEFGTVATPFERRPFSAELAFSQRYFEMGPCAVTAYMQSTTAGKIIDRFKVTKRAIPSLKANPIAGGAYLSQDPTGAFSAGANSGLSALTLSWYNSPSSTEGFAADVSTTTGIYTGFVYLWNNFQLPFWSANAEL